MCRRLRSNKKKKHIKHKIYIYLHYMCVLVRKRSSFETGKRRETKKEPRESEIVAAENYVCVCREDCVVIRKKSTHKTQNLHIFALYMCVFVRKRSFETGKRRETKKNPRESEIIAAENYVCVCVEDCVVIRKNST